MGWLHLRATGGTFEIGRRPRDITAPHRRVDHLVMSGSVECQPFAGKMDLLDRRAEQRLQIMLGHLAK